MSCQSLLSFLHLREEERNVCWNKFLLAIYSGACDSKLIQKKRRLTEWKTFTSAVHCSSLQLKQCVVFPLPFVMYGSRFWDSYLQPGKGRSLDWMLSSLAGLIQFSCLIYHPCDVMFIEIWIFCKPVMNCKWIIILILILYRTWTHWN